MAENLQYLHARYTEYMKAAAADLESLRGALPPDEQESYGVKRLDLDSFGRFWHRVSRDPALRQRWIRRLESGYAQESKRIARLVDEFLALPETSRRDAAA